jgi:Domain of unknown function (DUF5134)
MGAPAWLTGIFAALMLTVAVYCAGRLIAARRWRRPTEVDTDTGHVVMGVAMAGMLAASLRILPAVVWEPVFGVGALWFASQALRARRGALTSPWRCLHPTPHLVECAAMLYMFLILPTIPARASGAAMATLSTSAPASRFSFLALALALFMFGYVVRVADRLTLHAPAPAHAPAQARALAPAPAHARALALAAQPALAVQLAGSSPAPMLATGFAPAETPAPSNCGAATIPSRRAILAPRCSALCKIAMGITMGYMLILML